MTARKVIVMGGGIAGLTAAALLAKRGLDVTLIEKEDKVGGYVTGFTRQGFYFDATGAFLAACAPGGEFYTLLEELELEKELTFHPIRAIRNVYPDFSLDLDYRNPSAYVQSIMEHFPAQAEKLQNYIDLTSKLGQEFLQFEKASWWRRLMLPFMFPTLFRYARHPHSVVLKHLFDNDHKIIQALSALPTTLPPSRLSYIFVAVMWAKVLKQGVFYPRGGMVAIGQALAGAIKNAGGEIICNAAVQELRVRGKKVDQVRLSNGKQLKGDYYIGAINPYLGEKLLSSGERLFGRLYNLARYQVSPSALLFYVGLPASALPADWPYFVSIHTGRDLEKESEALVAGSLENGLHIVITVPSIIDSTLAPQEHHTLKVLVHAPHAGLFAQRYGTAGEIEKVQKRIMRLIKKSSGLDMEKHALFIERATPQTLIRYTNNEEGAMYGFDAACGQVGPQRPPNQTRLDNLLWVGHYTRPAHGIVGSALSSSFAANRIQLPLVSN